MNKLKIRFWTTLLSAFAVMAFIQGCQDENVEVLTECPLVVSTIPDDGDINVPFDQVITVTFNTEMDPASMVPSVFALDGGSTSIRGMANVPGQFLFNESTNSFTFTPTDELLPNYTYTGSVGVSATSIDGVHLQEVYEWTFYTGAPLFPFITLTDPEDDEIDVELSRTIGVTFNEAMDETTVDDLSFLLTLNGNTVDGVVQYTGAGNLFTFNPDQNLIPGSTYEVTVTNDVTNAAGLAMQFDSTWTFTTIVGPTITDIDPESEQIDVPLNHVIRITFSEAMNLTSVQSAISLTVGGTLLNGVLTGGELVDGAIAYTGANNIYTFTPDVNLLSDSTYTVWVTTDAQNATTIPLAADSLWNFYTVAPLGPPLTDLGLILEFAIFAAQGITSTGNSEIHDLDVAIYPNPRASVTGFAVVDGGPGVIFNGDFYGAGDPGTVGTYASVDAYLLAVRDDLVAAYLEAEGATIPAPQAISDFAVDLDLGGETLPPGIYTSAVAISVATGNLTLDGLGDANAVWIFQLAEGFTTIGGGPFPSASGGNIILINGAQAKNVIWQVGSSATIGDYTSFKGNVLALTSITLNSYAEMEGRLLVQTAAVTLASTGIIRRP